MTLLHENHDVATSVMPSSPFSRHEEQLVNFLADE